LRLSTRDDSDPDARGFVVWVEATAGVGTAIVRGRGRRAGEDRPTVVDGLSANLPAEDIGLQPDFEMTRKLRDLLWSDVALNLARSRMQMLQEEAARRRMARIQERSDITRLIDDRFYYQVYLRPGLPIAQIVRHCTNIQGPESPLHTLPDAFQGALDFLDRRQRIVTDSPVSMLWFLMWHDVWDRNSSLAIVRRNQDILNPANPAALAYTTMPRADLEVLLRERGLLVGAWGILGRSGIIKQFHIDLLYAHLRFVWLGSVAGSI
jgi:hypothetical protein